MSNDNGDSDLTKRPMTPETPLTKGNLPAAFIESMAELFNMLKAWNRFGADATAFLRDHGLADEFAAYQKRQTVKAAAQKQRRTSRAPNG
jgi:hypothetical protein